MVRVVVGGQMDKQAIGREVEKHREDGFTVEILSDIQASLEVKTGQADYYIGACATGAGGALGMAIGILGAPACASISLPGKRLAASDLDRLLGEGKKAFGLVNQDIEVMVPLLLDRIKLARSTQ